MRSWGPLPTALVGSLAAIAMVACALPAADGEVSLKTENYLFAATEALDDGDPALALSLLKRAKTEDPECCILDEYLARTYAELGELDRATEAYTDFVGCMEPSDEPIRQELEELLGEVRRSAPAEVDPDDDPGTSPIGSTRVERAPRIRRGNARPGLVVAGIGGGLAAGFGATATITFVQSRQWIEQGDRELYDARRPLNNVTFIAAAASGGVALAGLIADLATAGRRNPARSTGLTAPVITPGPGRAGLAATWRF